MKKIKLLSILYISGLLACNNPEKNSEKLILNEKNLSTQNDKLKVLTNETITELDSNKNYSRTVVSVNGQTNKKQDKTAAKNDFLIESVQRDEKNYIIPGFVRNEFIKDGNNYYFKRVVKQEEDSRVGCSGDGNEISFTIINPADTFFLIENEMLKTLNFKYRINGGLYWEEGGSPHKGIIKGKWLPDNTCQVEINVWIKMRDLQFNKQIERQIIVNDKFIP
jgi:hypothetical protein